MRFVIFVYIAFILITGYQAVYSQPYQYFNSRYDLNGAYGIDRSYNILESSDGYVLAGYSIVTSGNIYWWENMLSKINLEGEVQFTKYYGEDSINYLFSPYSGFMIKDNSEFYAVSKRRIYTTNGVHEEGILMHINENLDTVWTKRYGEKTAPYDTMYSLTCLEKTDQNQLIISGFWKPYGLASHVYLLKSDSLGQMLWENSIGYYNKYIEAYSVSETPDKGFVIGCRSYIPGYNYTIDPIVIKTDSVGNQEWTKNLGGPYMDNKTVVRISKDSMIIVGTNYADSMYSPDIPLSRINLVKIDNLGNMIWNKKYGVSQPNNYLRNLRILSDGSIITVGALRKNNPESEFVGWILKTSSEGDSLWYREYEFLLGQESYNHLFDIYETSDKGLIACGYVDPSLPDTGSVDTWIIKLDSIGCDTAGCDPTVGIVEYENTRIREGERMEIWPNPAIDVIHVRMDAWTHVPFPKDVTLAIYDIYGRNISSSPLHPFSPSKEITLDISGYSPGLYIITITGDRLETLSGKFVICR